MPRHDLLFPLDHLVSDEGAEQLREEFLAGASAPDIGGGVSRYDEAQDALVGYSLNLDPESGPVGHRDFVLTYPDFLSTRLRLACREVRHRFEDALVASGPKKAPRTLRLYAGQIAACEASASRSFDPTCRKRIRGVLSALTEEIERTVRSFQDGKSSKGSTSGSSLGRPLDPQADQSAIAARVLEMAGMRRFQHPDGRPKPTTIRDVLLNEHSEVCGELSERALFDRVKRALIESQRDG